MALNIKPYYPFDHPTSVIGVSELIDKISTPTATAVYLKTELKKDETFKHNDDIYLKVFRPKWKEREHNLNDSCKKLLDVI